MKQPRPNCRCCNTPLSKATKWHNAEDGKYFSKADLIPLLGPNEVITSVRFAHGYYDANRHGYVTYASLGKPEPISQFRTWDGVSWGKWCWIKDKRFAPGFCSTYCLQKFAVEAAAAYPDFRVAA